MIKVKCSLFGRMRLDLSTGQDLILKGKKGPALFAYLMVCQNNHEKRDTLVRLLWPRSGGESGKASLRQTMSDLKRQFVAVGLDLLQSHPNDIDIVMLSKKQIDSDIAEFEHWRSQVGFNAFESLLLSYSGEFMQGFESKDENFMAWIYKQRNAYKDEVLLKYKQMQVLEQERPSRQRVSRLALKVLELDPTCEHAYQKLMSCELAVGEYAAAMLHYQKCRAMIVEKYDVQPSDETETLYREIVSKQGNSQMGGVHGVPAVPAKMSRKLTTLAVLAIDYQVDDTDLSDLFSEMGVEISIAVNKFKWISVLNSISTERLQHDGISAGIIKDLGVHYILTGSVRRIDSSFIANIDLAESLASTSIWTERFEGSADDIIGGLDTMISRIACRVDIQLRTAEIRRVAAMNTNQLSAAELTLLGIHHLHEMTEDSFNTAYQYLQRAIDQNPSYSWSYSWLSYWEVFYVGQRWASEEYLQNSPAGDLARAAIRRNPEDALALAVSGHFHAFLHHNFDTALDYFRRSLILNPYSAFAWMLSSATYSYIGESEEAINRLNKAQDLCPIEPHFEYLYSSARCVSYIFAGQYEQSIKWGRRSVSDNPTFSNGIKQLLVGLGHLQLHSEAEVYVEKLLELEPKFCIREFLTKYPAKKSEDLHRLAEGLRIAGVPEC